MNRSIKAALAASAAGVLLVGGAGSLAFWSDSKDAGTAAISSGNLSLSALDCTTGSGAHDWQLDNNTAYTPGTTKVVPGDTISKVCDTTLTLTGEHVGATLSIDTANITPDSTSLAAQLTPTATFTVDGNAYAPITGAGTHTVRATISISFDGAAATNASQDGAVNLDAVLVKAQQTHATS